jgi:hypothetical protein
MSGYTFMSTGFGLDSDGALDEGFVKKLLALVYTMIKNAANTAGTYADHGGRESVTRGDVILALKYEAKHFLTYENLENDSNRQGGVGRGRGLGVGRRGRTN